jgi:UDPglucose--hexose-1-phosphate uridylyltransferase
MVEEFSNTENINKKEEEFPSEIRCDIVSGDWVVIASGRAKRPDMFKNERKTQEVIPADNCPFCDFENLKNAIVSFEDGKKVEKFTENWSAISIPNKFPAFIPSDKLERKYEGDLYQTMNAVGHHEVVITKDHYKSLGELPVEKVREVFALYKQRYTELKEKEFVNYVSIFHNHGKEAGASMAHPHSQIITVPLVDVDLKNSLKKGKEYHQNKEKCVYCQMNELEMQKKERIVYENELFLVVCPFASKAAFQMIVSPKKHLAYFEEATEKELDSLADAFHAALAKLHKGLNNPAYNFYLHCAPSDGINHDYYHWHWTIIPKTSVWGGFEMGARMEVSTIKPEKAAEYLREQEI